MNWQHCAHVVSFASHSYEQYYQAVRRCWRFGQKRKVVVDLIASKGEENIKDNMRRKAEAADLEERFLGAVEGRSPGPGSPPAKTPKKKPREPGQG